MSPETLNGWQVVSGHHLEKEFRFPDFAQALSFVNRAGSVAEAENHHPEILLSWGKVLVRTWTHSTHGLTDRDYVLAQKLDEQYKSEEKKTC